MLNAELTEVGRREIEETQVVLIAGGLGKRLGRPDIPKCLIEVNGKPLIEWSIGLFRLNGFLDFVLLLGYKGKMVEELVGDGSKYGVNVTYSYDPMEPERMGKGKAIKHALLTGKIDNKKRSIVAYPDDMYLELGLPRRLLAKHLEYVRRRGIISTVVLVRDFRLPYGVAKINSEGLVESFEEKPILDLLINAGMYVLEPKAYSYVIENVYMDSDGPVDLETAVLPKIASRGLLASFVIPSSSWVPVNTIKDLEEASKRADDLSL